MSFFKKIGSSLPIRRAFRNWMSNKISQNTNDIEIFIEEIIDDELTDMFWKDEIIVSILLSKYSNVFSITMMMNFSVTNSIYLKDYVSC